MVVWLARICNKSIGRIVCTAAVVQVSLHKQSDSHLLAGMYLNYVQSIPVWDQFNKKQSKTGLSLAPKLLALCPMCSNFLPSFLVSQTQLLGVIFNKVMNKANWGGGG